MRENVGLLNACIGLLICMTFANYVSYMLTDSLIDEKRVNLQLITIKDYSVQFTIPKGLYEAFSKARGGKDI